MSAAAKPTQSTILLPIEIESTAGLKRGRTSLFPRVWLSIKQVFNNNNSASYAFTAKVALASNIATTVGIERDFQRAAEVPKIVAFSSSWFRFSSSREGEKTGCRRRIVLIEDLVAEDKWLGSR